MTDDSNIWPKLRKGEEDITESSDTCLRNVHPQFIVEGIVSSAAFMPTRNDEGELSTARSSKVSAEQHFNEFTHMNHQSAGVYEVATEDIRNEELRWIDNESIQEESIRMTGHAYIDYRVYSNGKTKKKARSLARHATLTYRPQGTE